MPAEDAYEESMRKLNDLMLTRNEWAKWSFGRSRLWYRRAIASLVALIGDDEILFFDAVGGSDEHDVGQFVFCTKDLIVRLSGSVGDPEEFVELDVQAEPVTDIQSLKVWSVRAPGQNDGWSVSPPGALKVTARLASGEELSLPYSPDKGDELGPLLHVLRSALSRSS